VGFTRPIYLDHNASAPLTRAARTAVEAALDLAGNPSSQHAAGRAARAVVEEARERVAAAIGARPAEIVFTSGGTEAIALGIAGAFHAAAPGRRLVLSAPTEHPSVGAALAGLAGARVGRAAIDAHGRTAPEALSRALEAEPALLVALASANNETGTRNDVAALARIAHERGALFFCDAVQSLGKEPLDARALGVDLLALSAHKIGGPKGVGALFVREGTPLHAQLRGGPQEAERRAGTENVAGIAGFGAAAKALPERISAMPRVRALRDRLAAALVGELTDTSVIRNGDPEGGLANTLNVSFRGVDGDALRIALDLDGIAVSGGSACASGAAGPSHVLLALGRDRELARAAVRFSLGLETTEADVDAAAEATVRHVRRLACAR
jgi:cysteine desulfurase